MPRVIHFELPVDDIERASRFYKDVFGWDTQGGDPEEGYWLVTTGPGDSPGIDGGFIARKFAPQLVNVVDVDSVDDAVKRAEAAGAKLVRPKDEIPNVGWVAYIEDTEGNTVGLFESASA